MQIAKPSTPSGSPSASSVAPPVKASDYLIIITIIIIMEICKAPTLRLKALNKHTHIMYI